MPVSTRRVARDEEYTRNILEAVASGHALTQRSLARSLGVALGLTNLLLRRLVAKGYVKVAGMGTRHVRYLMTPEGWECLGRMTRNSLHNTVHLYTETREQIRESLQRVSDRCVSDIQGAKSVVFYGAGDVAEIAYVSLQRTDLKLMAVADDYRRGHFFGLAIQAPEVLVGEMLRAQWRPHIVVTSIRHSVAIRARLRSLDVPPEQLSCL